MLMKTQISFQVRIDEIGLRSTEGENCQNENQQICGESHGTLQLACLVLYSAAQ